LKFKTPYEKVIEEYKNNPNVFLINPDQKKLELNRTIFQKFLARFS